MRHIGDLLKELGFNKDAPLETQKAFVRHLIQEANRAENKLAPMAPVPTEQPKESTSPMKAVGEQLSFNFDDSKKTG